MKTKILIRSFFLFLPLLFDVTYAATLPGLGHAVCISAKPKNIPKSVQQMPLKVAGEEVLDSCIREFFNAESEEWKLSEKFCWGYDEYGFKTLYAGFSRNNENTAWVNWIKDEYMNDEKGNMIQSVYSFWNEDNGEWNPNSKGLFVYDNAGNLISDTIYRWDPLHDKWNISGKGLFTSNPGENSKEEFFWVYDTAEATWINDYKDEFTLDDNGNKIHYIAYSWNRDSARWMEETKIIYVWNENGQITLFTAYDWNEESGEWEEDNKRVFEYDHNGNQVRSIYYNMDGDWIFYDKLETIYEENKKHQDVRYIWNKSLNEWIYDYRQTYYSHETIVDLQEIFDKYALTIYPNPAQDYFYVHEYRESSTVIIYDLQGKQVMSQKMNTGDPICIQQLPEGIYILKLQNDNKTMVGKIAIVR